MGMTRRQMYISIVLMALAIGALIAFQTFWLRKNYQEEQQTLRIQTNVLFREAVFESQASRIQLDTTINIRRAAAGPAIRVVSALQSRYRDSTSPNRKAKGRVFISLEGPHRRSDTVIALRNDTLAFRRLSATPGEKAFIKILESAEGMKDSLTIKEISDKYAAMLKREGINLPFLISRFDGVRRDEFIPPELEEANEVSIGLVKPVTFRVDVDNTTGYVLRKMSSSIIVSVLLVALTVASFLLLLRNLIQQQRLTTMKNDFISNITHELRTPIATVSVAIEALKNFNALSDPARTKEYLDISGSELQRLSLLVDKVLKLSMFEKHQIELKNDAFDMKNLVEEVIATMRLQFEKAGAQVNFQTEGNDFNTRADRVHITSIVFNLLDNALKYSKANPKVDVQLTSTADSMVLSVADNGIGILPEHQKKIFEKFYRVQSGNTHNVKGYGLGLSYVSYVVERHYGSIEVKSTIGEGSRFIIKLPKTNEQG